MRKLEAIEKKIAGIERELARAESILNDTTPKTLRSAKKNWPDLSNILGENPQELRDRLRVIRTVFDEYEQGKRDLSGGNLRLVVSPRNTATAACPSWTSSRRQHRPDAGGRQVRVPPGLQVLDVRHLVDPSGHHPGHRRPRPNHSGARAHDRNHVQGWNIQKHLVQEHGREPTVEEVAERARMSVDETRRVMKIARR